MISRKRQNSPTPAASENPSKRARILSNLWHSDKTSTFDKARNKEVSRRTRPTRAIGEATGQDPSSRKDSHSTEPKNTTTRHPRKSHLDAAIDTVEWNPSNSSGPRRHSSRSVSEREDESIKIKVGHTPRVQRPERVIDTHLHPSESETHNLYPTKVPRNPAPCPTSATLPAFTVQISRHSSVERDQYILYQSSRSTQGDLSSLPPHQDSGLGDSPFPSSSISEKANQNDFVPDSQVLAGSSSYVPSRSVSELTSSNQSSRDLAINHSSRISDNSDLDYFGAREPETDQTGDDLSSFVVSASAVEDLSISLQRSRSVPTQSSSAASGKPSPRCAAAAQPTRSVSDLGSVIPDSPEQVFLTPPGQTSTQRANSFSVENNLGQNLESSSPELEFRTQVSLVLDSQIAQASTDLSEENWQSGQIIPENDKSASQISSESIGQIVDHSVVSSRERASPLVVDKSARRQHSAVPEAFDISEDPVEDSQATQATESSTLSQRDPNSRKDRHPQSAQDKREVIVTSIESLDPGIENVSDSLQSHPPPLLDALESGYSPSFLSPTMSDQQPPRSGSATVPDRLPPPSGFFTRSSQQANAGPPHGYSTRSPMPHRVPPQAGYFLGRTPSAHTAGNPPVSVQSEPAISDRDNARAGRMASSRPLPMAGVAGSGASPPVSLREKLREMRATSKANVAPREPARAPSIVVDKEVQPQEAQSRLDVRPLKVPVEMPLPVRAVQPPPPHTPTYPSKLSYHTEASYSQKSTALTPVHLKEMEFVVPLSMNPRVRDQYTSTIEFYQRDIEQFMKERAPSNDLVDEIRTMLDRVNQVTTHIDLDGGGDESIHGQQAPGDEAVWAETCSAKFLFLRHFLDALRYFDVHIAIVARSGQLHDIIETFLKGTHTKYSRPETVSKSEPNVSKGRLEVTLIASGEEGASSLPKNANLVIAFDGSFNAQDVQVGILRGHLLNVGQLSPVIHLLVYKSAEHIERCLPKSMDPVERLRKTVSCMIQTRHEVGQLLPDEANTAAVAEEAAAFLELGGLERDWTFPSIRAIENVEGGEFPARESTNKSENPMSMEQNITSQSLAVKRALELEEFSAPLKRQRSTPIGDITHGTDSIVQDSQPTNIMASTARRRLEADLLATRTECDRLEDDRAKLRSERETLVKGLNDAKSEIALLKSERHMLRQQRDTLQTDLTKSTSFARDLEASLGELQTRFEKKNDRCHTLRYDNDDLETKVNAAKQKQSHQAAEIAKLVEARASLEQELRAARDALLSSNNPSIASLESLNGENRDLRATIVNLEKKVASQAHDNDYIRQEYQNASSAAATSANQITALQRDLEVAQRRAQGEATRLASINRTNETSQLLATVERQSLELASRERLLQKQAEDLKEFKEFKRGRGGVVTRGSSVQAKSPRSRSRAGSPGVGGGGHGKVGGSSLRYGSRAEGDGR
ncbi:hypothetical protein MMC07_009370 [Pseudocyphellaria aurata]|nr:hypothetical protein [Pseudocyphellaria aurata]